MDPSKDQNNGYLPNTTNNDEMRFEYGRRPFYMGDSDNEIEEGHNNFSDTHHQQQDTNDGMHIDDREHIDEGAYSGGGQNIDNGEYPNGGASIHDDEHVDSGEQMEIDTGATTYSDNSSHVTDGLLAPAANSTSQAVLENDLLSRIDPQILQPLFPNSINTPGNTADINAPVADGALLGRAQPSISSTSQPQFGLSTSVQSQFGESGVNNDDSMEIDLESDTEHQDTVKKDKGKGKAKAVDTTAYSTQFIRQESEEPLFVSSDSEDDDSIPPPPPPPSTAVAGPSRSAKRGKKRQRARSPSPSSSDDEDDDQPQVKKPAAKKKQKKSTDPGQRVYWDFSAGQEQATPELFGDFTNRVNHFIQNFDSWTTDEQDERRTEIAAALEHLFVVGGVTEAILVSAGMMGEYGSLRAIRRRSDLFEDGLAALADEIRVKWEDDHRSGDFHSGQQLISKRRNNGTYGSSWETDPDKWKAHSALTEGSNGLQNGQWFPDQAHAVQAGAHGSFYGGIHVCGDPGALSIIVGGGGFDDEDTGDKLTYCSQNKPKKDGGEEAAGTKGMLRAHDLGRSVRVNRSAKLHKSNKFRPAAGIRYDGTYKVDKVNVVTGKPYNFTFELVRDEGQEPIRVNRPTAEEVSELARQSSLISAATAALRQQLRARDEAAAGAVVAGPSGTAGSANGEASGDVSDAVSEHEDENQGENLAGDAGVGEAELSEEMDLDSDDDEED